MNFLVIFHLDRLTKGEYKKKEPRYVMKPGRFAYLATSALFLFFLIYSTPHRVHHFFDEHKAHRTSTIDQDPQSERDTTNTPDTPCVIQTAAKTCQAGLPSIIGVASIPSFIKKVLFPFTTRISSYFLPSAFQIRAPPPKA